MSFAARLLAAVATPLGPGRVEEHQALELGRFQGFDLPLDGLTDVKAVPAGERRLARVITLAFCRGQFVRLGLT